MKLRSFVVCVFILCAAVLSPTAVAAQGNSSIAAALNAYRPPTPVIEVNEAAKKPVAYWAMLYFPAGEETGDDRKAMYKETEDFFVPEGMTLVIEYANTEACYAPGEKMSIGIKTGYGEGKTPAHLKILLTEQGVFNEPGGAYTHAGSSQPMKTYIRGGESFRFTAWRSGGSTHAEVEFWATAYLVPAVMPATRGQ